MLSKLLKKNNINNYQFYAGKVRDIHKINNNYWLMETTDRLTAFDRFITLIPHKGAILNLTSEWWFNHINIKNIVNNHWIDRITPEISVIKPVRVIPIEWVMRGYITGTTQTSLWVRYQNNLLNKNNTLEIYSDNNNYKNNKLPDNLVKNQQLPQPILTPTTKDKDHDLPISRAEAIAKNLINAKQWDEILAISTHLFLTGQQIANHKNLILVDTKYEFGLDHNNKIILIDELHTPDSSRYWLKSSYLTKFNLNQEPDCFDKEFIRRWLVQQCDPYTIENIPEIPQDLIHETSQKYITLYQQLTGENFLINNNNLENIFEKIKIYI